MAGFLIGEEGPLTGLILRFVEGEEWVLGRDPDEVDLVLEDPMVSRRHVIARITPEGYVLENLSSVNPATQNGKVITDSVLMREGDIIQIGNTFFRFTEKEPAPSKKEEKPEELMPIEEPEELASIQYDLSVMTRWLLKVVSGPNSGAEFNLQKGGTYILGKDPNLCDIVFQDLSVSRQHARLSVDDQQQVYIEDMGSRNGVLVNGEIITERKLLSSEDLVALGTTSFLVIDREQVRETIISPPSVFPKETPATIEEIVEEEVTPRDWKEMIIPKKWLMWSGVGALFLFLLIFSMFTLLKSEPVIVNEKNETKQIKEVIEHFPDVQFTFNASNGNLLLIGHVLTGIDKKELVYKLNTLPFIQKIDDNIVIDEFVWQNMNALLAVNPSWSGVSFTSPTPGHFVMRGYVLTLDQLIALNDYINMNFPYVDRLENQVVVEQNLATQVESELIAKGFSGVTFELKDGELVLSGRVEAKMQHNFGKVVDDFRHVHGIRQIKNFVIYTTADTSRIDLTERYHVTGYSKKDEKSYFVVVNGRIVSHGDTIDGMLITSVEPNVVLLEKDGLKFKINYNQQ